MSQRIATKRWRDVLPAGVLVAGMAFVALRVVGGRSESDPRAVLRSELVAELVRSADPAKYRPIEARLAGGFAYRPRVEREDGGQAPNGPWQLLSAVAKVRLEYDRGVSAAIDPYGVALLLIGRPDAAAEIFESQVLDCAKRGDVRAAIRDCRDAELLCDLSAAYHAAAADGRHAERYVAAAEAAERAWALAQTPENAWNRALAIEQLQVVPAALRAWQDYLEVEPRSSWSTEARRHLQALERAQRAPRWSNEEPRFAAALAGGRKGEAARIACRFPHDARQYAELVLLAEVVHASVEGKRREAVARLADAGAALFGCTGDAIFSDTAEWLRRDDRAVPLAAAYLAARGSEAMAGVRRRLDAAGSPLADAAIVEIAKRAFAERHYEDALHAAACVGERYPVSKAQAEWIRGMAEICLGFASASDRTYRRAAAAFERFGDRQSLGAIQFILAENRDYAGDGGEAWQIYREALRNLAGGDRDRLVLAMCSAGQTAMRHGYLRVALLYQNAIAVTASATPPAHLCRVRLIRASIHRRLGDLRAAWEDLRRAQEALAAVRDGKAAERLRGDLREEYAQLVTDPAEAISAIDDAVRVAAGRADHFRLARLHLLRGRTSLRMGDVAAAKRDFQSGVAEIEGERLKLDRATRISYFDTVQALYAELSGALLREGRVEEAFEAADERKARVLLETVGRGEAAAGDLAASVRRALAADEALVELSTIGDSVQAWVVTPGAVIPVKTLSRSAAERLVRLVLESCRESESGSSTAAAELFDRLMAPLEGALAGTKSLIIVADGALTELPFAALVDRRSGTYAVERFAISYAPSARMFAMGRAGARPSTPALSAVVVAAPAVNARLAGELPKLPGVENDVRAVRQAVPGAVVLPGPSATASRLWAQAPAADILHFACHTARSEDGSLGLALAPDSAVRDGVLTPSAIEARRLERAPVVVLAACSTGEGRVTSEGALSLSRSFLAAGAGSVIATRWPVEDRPASELFRRFYAAMAERRLSPRDALRDAQLSMLRAPATRHPSLWAAYAVSE